MFATVRTESDAAFRRLIGRIIDFYAAALFNPHWGEQISFRRGNVLALAMVFQGLSQQEAEAIWRPFFEWIQNSPQDYSIVSPPVILAAPARHFWDPDFLKKIPGIVLADDRAGASAGNVFWAGNLGEAGQVLHGYQSAWLPASLLRKDQQENLADTLFAATRHWSASLHVNKGLAGAPAEAVDAARDTAMNPAVLDALALVVSGAEGPPAYPGVVGREPDLATGRSHAKAIDKRWTKYASCFRPSALTYRRAIISITRGGNPTGVHTMRDCSRSKTNTIPTVSSLCITASVASAGARTALPKSPEPALALSG